MSGAAEIGLLLEVVPGSMLHVGEQRRSRLHLSLNRGLCGCNCNPNSSGNNNTSSGNLHTTPPVLHHPSPPLQKRCRLEICSLAPHHEPIQRIRTIQANELAERLSRPQHQTPPILLDCRPFLSYNTSHIAGAINVNCVDRINRRRMLQGRVALWDLVSTKEGKEFLKKNLPTKEDVVLYDDSTMDLDKLAPCHPLALVMNLLCQHGAQPLVLKGGWRDFHRYHSDLCRSTQQLKCIPSISDVDNVPRLEPLTSTPEIIPSGDIQNIPASAILPFLYLGNERDAADPVRLRTLGIGYVLNVTAHVPGLYHEEGIKFKRLPASDSCVQNLKQYFEEAFTFIDEARNSGSRILVHCQAGISRSPTITIAYIMQHTLMPLVDAYRMVKSKRPIISPNLNFMGQLMELEETLRSSRGTTEPDCKPCRQCMVSTSKAVPPPSRVDSSSLAGPGI